MVLVDPRGRDARGADAGAGRGADRRRERERERPAAKAVPAPTPAPAAAASAADKAVVTPAAAAVVGAAAAKAASAAPSGNSKDQGRDPAEVATSASTNSSGGNKSIRTNGERAVRQPAPVTAWVNLRLTAACTEQEVRAAMAPMTVRKTRAWGRTVAAVAAP
jgi:hypothetical protein